MKPGPGLEPTVLSHHPAQAVRCEDPSPHSDKQNPNSQNHGHKVKYDCHADNIESNA